MAQITKEITVDVAKKNLFQAIIAKQNDSDSRFLKVTLCNEGTEIEVPLTTTALINAERADGSSKAFVGTVNEDGTVTVPLTNWMLELDDIVRCSISIVGSNGEKLTSTSFSVEVESAEISNSGISEDENYDILVRLISDTADAKSACEAAATKAVSAAEAANNAANEAKPGKDGLTPLLQKTDSAIQVSYDNGSTYNDLIPLSKITGEKGEKGDKGDPGEKGADGTSVGLMLTTESHDDDGYNTVVFTDGNSLRIKNGSKGTTGEKGEKGDTGASGSDGYTPIKGTDYFTNSDKQEIIDAVIDALSTVAVTVDETNNITLNGDLSDGTYIVSYKNTDGSLSNIGTLTVGDATSEPTLSFFSVSYDDSVAVVAGTELAELNEVVKAVYTDGTQTSALTEGTDYSLSGTLVAGQTNVVTVTGKGTYASLPSVTFNVTVAAESVIPSYTNLVPTSLDPTNLTQVFNTTGYMDGARMSYTLSGGVLYRTDNSGGCCSGFIPFSSGNTFYIKADSITDTNTYTGGIVITRCLTGDTTVVASGATATAISKDTYWSHEKLSDNYYKVVLRHPYNESDGTVGFCVNAGGTGANLIVAKEPIE